MKKTLISLALACFVVFLLAYISGGLSLVAEGLLKAGQTAIQVLLLIVAAFLVIGQLQTLISTEMIKSWLQKFSGNKGIFLSSLTGGLFPGGPYIFYPFLAGFKDKGIPFYLLFAFVSGKQTFDFTRLPLEISLLTPWLALVRNVITLPVPFITGLISKRFFPHGVKGILWEEGDQR